MLNNRIIKIKITNNQKNSKNKIIISRTVINILIIIKIIMIMMMAVINEIMTYKIKIKICFLKDFNIKIIIKI